MKHQKRLVEDPVLVPFYAGIDEFCRENLPPDSRRTSTHRKIIADPIEGYCAMEGWEVSIIDTQLFQRLRSIRQLGLAYLVYPTLGYSRFEHTIGVIARFKQVMSSVSENSAVKFDGNQPVITQKQMVSARLALLCHDVGHCAFSHVSEEVISELKGSRDYPSSATIIKAFGDVIGRPVPIAEILSVCIMTSPEFVQFIKDICVPFAVKYSEAEQLAHNAANLVLGMPIPQDPKSLFLAQMMSSGLDVDKLDYMMRESHLSGITLGISLDWLLKKLFILDVNAYQLPEGLKRRVASFPSGERFSVLALERGGQFAFEEFCVARLALHEKIYLHQKIRAAEAQLKFGFRRMGSEVSEYGRLDQWLRLKETVFECPDSELPGLPKQPDLFSNSRKYTIRSFGLDRISSRLLLSRAYAFGWQNSLADPIVRRGGDEELGVDSLMKRVRLDHMSFISRIRDELGKMRNILLESDSIPPTDIQILVDPPRETTIQQGHDTVYIEYPSQLSLRWTMPVDRIEDYYHRNRALGYVFSEPEFLPLILLASEKAAWEMCNVFCVQEGLVNSRVVEEANELKALLHNAGYYSGARILQPVSEYLSGVGPQALIAAVARKLVHYESRTHRRVSPASVTTFISQFPTQLQDAALSWIQHIALIRPDEQLRKEFGSAIDRGPFRRCHTIGFSPLGAMSDSAARIAYDLRDIGDTLGPNRRVAQVPLAEALGSGYDGYVIYDDNTNSGYQALNILAAWMGIELEEKYRLKEDHVQELPGDLKEEFRRKPVSVIFAVATDDATEKLSSLCVDILGLDASLFHVSSSVTFPRLKRIFSGEDSPFQHQDKLKRRDFIKSITIEVLRNEGKSEDESVKRSLGDASAEAMVVFPYNCPTMTVPALWIRGRCSLGEWEPLVERGRRRDPAGQCFVGEDA